MFLLHLTITTSNLCCMPACCLWMIVRHTARHCRLCVTDGELLWPPCTYETGRWFGWHLVEYVSHCWWWFYDVRYRLDRLVTPGDTQNDVTKWRCLAAVLPHCFVNDASCETTWKKNRNVYRHCCTAVDDASVMAYWAEQGFPPDNSKILHTLFFVHFKSPSAYCLRCMLGWNIWSACHCY